MNGGGYLVAARLYTRPYDAIKRDNEGKNTEGKTVVNLEVTKRNIATTTIK